MVAKREKDDREGGIKGWYDQLQYGVRGWVLVQSWNGRDVEEDVARVEQRKTDFGGKTRDRTRLTTREDVSRLT